MAKTKRTRPEPQQIGHLKVDIVYVTVDDPFYSKSHDGKRGNSKYAKAALNMNENIAAHWKAKQIITDAEYMAASRYRGLYERVGGRGACSIDLTKEVVDGGVMADPISLTQMQASQELKEIHNLLGPQGYDIVEKLCGQCIRLEKLATKRRDRDQISLICQSMLKRMAVHWDYQLLR